jgi:hypothetical protein
MLAARWQPTPLDLCHEPLGQVTSPLIHGPRSIEQELDHLTKDLELTPNQRKQIKPLLEEHHEVEALLTDH